MVTRVAHATVDCSDVELVARFWSAALGRPVERGEDSTYAYVGAAEEPVRLCVMRTPDRKAAKNRVHLDLEADDRAAEVERLVGLGAEILTDYNEAGLQWTTLRDVEGNEFCVF
jgi:predicted enzyme related to lactoylglutathione lyase